MRQLQNQLIKNNVKSSRSAKPLPSIADRLRDIVRKFVI
jgi:hypothetical protein